MKDPDPLAGTAPVGGTGLELGAQMILPRNPLADGFARLWITPGPAAEKAEFLWQGRRKGWQAGFPFPAAAPLQGFLAGRHGLPGTVNGADGHEFTAIDQVERLAVEGRAAARAFDDMGPDVTIFLKRRTDAQ